MEATLARAWWVLVLRGVVGILFGLVAFTMPLATMHALILLFAIYIIIDGVIAFISAFQAASQNDRWWPFLVEGVIGLLVGVGTLFAPGITVLALVTVAGAWALVTGIFEIIAAIRLRRVIQREWALILAGIFSVLFGAAVLIFPLPAAVWFVILLGAYAMVFGVLFIVLGLRLRSHVTKMAAGPV